MKNLNLMCRLKRFMCALLVFIMAVSLLPVSAFATQPAQDSPAGETQQDFNPGIKMDKMYQGTTFADISSDHYAFSVDAKDLMGPHYEIIFTCSTLHFPLDFHAIVCYTIAEKN